MTAIFRACFVVLLALAPAWAWSQNLTENIVRKLIEQTDDAVKRKDAAAIDKMLSPKFTVEMEIKIGGEKQLMKMNRAEYLDSLRLGWKVSQANTYKRENLSIKVINPSRAVVTADILESMTINGKALRSKFFEIAWIEMIGGKPLVVSAEASGEIF